MRKSVVLRIVAYMFPFTNKLAYFKKQHTNRQINNMLTCYKLLFYFTFFLINTII